jgi:eukaryotic-like serine/threonine-protein kinase
MTLEQGAILHGRYRIVEILGQGGMGSVYRAIDENLGVEVAVKENLFTTDEYARQFRLEAVILASLRQPNLPRVSDHFVVNGQGQYLVMDYIEGEDLRQRMERIGNIPEEEAIMIGASICDALAYLHTRKPPVLHRDLKPGNVKITPEGHVFLVDFGLAKVVRGTQATTTGARAMTPGYSPPEQYGTARTDAHSDIYSLGATLYAALTGVIPEDGLARVMDNVQLTPLRKRNPKVSRKLAAAIEKAMEPYPDDRFKSDEEFKQALLAASAKTQKPDGEYVVASAAVMADRPPSKPISAIEQQADKVGIKENTPARLKRRRKRSLGWLAFSLLLVLIVVVSLGLVINYPSIIPPEAVGYLPPGWLPSPTPTVTETQTKVTTNETVVVIPPLTDSPPATPTKHIPLSPTNTSTPTITFTPTITPTLIGGGLGTIAFASKRSGIPQIYLMNSDGTDQRAITTETDGACQPDWSPDGTQIVYISPCRLKDSDYPGANLYIMNADGSGKQPLGGSIEGDYDPAWSPDGKSIAFTSLRDGFPQIYKIVLETGEITRLTETEANKKTRQPTWSPDGTQIAYVLWRVGLNQIWVMTNSGQAQQQLVRSGSQFSDYHPAWSPDGAFLSFSQTDIVITNPSPSWLMTMRYEDRKSLPGVKVNAEPPIVDVDYSPDGYWLVFESVSADPTGSNQDIYLMTISGGDRTRLTRDPDADFDPAWKPKDQPAATPTATP